MRLKRLIAAMVSAGMVASIIGATPVNFVTAVETPVFNTFDANYDGWYNVGDLATVTALPGGYNSARAMFVDNRQTPEDGAEAQKGYYLGGGVKYNYSVFVKADTDEEFILTLRYLYPDETYGYETLAVKNVKAGEWTEIKAVYTAPKNTVNLSPIISTTSTNDFWFDSFKVTTTTEKASTFEIDAALGDDGLKDVYANYFRVGGCVAGNGIGNSTVQGIVLQHYNSITPENELKPDSTVNTGASSGNNVAVRLNSVATMMDFCIQNNIGMRGHVLFWHAQTPSALFYQGYNTNNVLATKADMEARMDSYVKNMFQTISTQYPDLNLYAYDVVNEAFSDSKTMSGNNWRAMNRDPGFNGTPGANAAVNTSGSPWITFWGDNSFIVEAFEIAAKYRDEYLPNMKLFYNDYNEYLGLQNGKHAAMKALATELFEAGTLDGVGMQSHVGDANYYTRANFLQAMDSFLEIGCEVQLTELDVTGNNTGAWYSEIFSHAAQKSDETNRLTAVIIWGTTQDRSWISSNGSNVVLFDSSGQPNVNFNAVGGTAIIPQSNWGDGDVPKGSGPPPAPPEPDEYGRFFFDTFESNIGNWADRDGGEQVTVARATPSKAYDGSGALSVTGRESTWMGASRSLNAREFVSGETYKFGGAVMAPIETNFKLSIYYTLDGETVYADIDAGTAPAGEWINLESTFAIPAGASGAAVYFETEYFEEGGNITDFYVDNAYGGTKDAVSPLVDIEPTPTTTTTVATTTKATTTTQATTTKTVTTTAAPTPETPDYGDIDRDGKVCDITDVVLLGKHISGKLTLSSSSQNYKNCNVNQVGSSADSVDVDDLKTVIDVMLGVDVSVPLK